VLEAADKAFGIGEFNAKALQHNLDNRDYGKPMSELRDDFWRVPRLPLLPNGESDLRSAIWEAVHAGAIAIVDNDGVPREAHSHNDINLASDMQRLAKPEELKPADGTKEGGAADDDTQEEAAPGKAEKKVTLSTTLSVDNDNRDALRVVLDALRNSVEEGDLSWLQLSVQATMTIKAAGDLDEKAQASGMHTTVSDL
jgi:hypothetical protein